MGETEPMTCISIFTWDKKKAPDNDGNGVAQLKGMRRSSSMGIFKAALGMLRTKSWNQLPVSESKSDQVDVEYKVEEKGNVPEKVTLEIVPGRIPGAGEEHKVEAMGSPLCPVPFSAMPVNDVSQNNSPREGIGKEKCGHRGDDDGGDEKIDTKAEAFIAQFYEQMKFQSMNS